MRSQARAFINGSDDARNTPAEPFRDAAGAEVRVHDPWVDPDAPPGLSRDLEGVLADAVVVFAGHKAFPVSSVSAAKTVRTVAIFPVSGEPQRRVFIGIPPWRCDKKPKHGLRHAIPSVRDIPTAACIPGNGNV